MPISSQNLETGIAASWRIISRSSKGPGGPRPTSSTPATRRAPHQGRCATRRPQPATAPREPSGPATHLPAGPDGPPPKLGLPPRYRRLRGLITTRGLSDRHLTGQHRQHDPELVLNRELRGATHDASHFLTQEPQLTPAPLSLTRDPAVRGQPQFSARMVSFRDCFLFLPITDE